MRNIRESIQSFINGGGNAVITVKRTTPGVLFTDENEFIPFSDLGYSSDLGYYRISQFPNRKNKTTNENPESIHQYDTGDPSDDWEAYIWVDASYTAHMLGTKAQCADLYNALGELLEKGTIDGEKISDSHPVWGRPLSISQACEAAVEWNPGEFQDNGSLASRIRQAAQAGRLIAEKDPAGRWQFPQDKLYEWVMDSNAHKTGAKPDIEELIGQDPTTIQNTLADLYREATGEIPRGQLWQPCELGSCENEPVCMNCLKCEEAHCKCFV